MNTGSKLLFSSSLCCAFALACSSTDQAVFSPTGGSGAALGGTSAGGADAGGAAGASAGQSPQGGEPSAGASSIAGTSSVMGGAAGAASTGSAGASVGGDGSMAGAASGGDSGSAGTGGALAGNGGVSAAGTGGASGSGGAGGGAPAPLLQNGSFEGGGLAPWQVTVTPSTVGKAVYTQWGPGGQSADGKYEVSFWNGTNAFTGDLHQTVTGLSPGKYRLTLYIAYGMGLNAAYLYAIECGPEDARVDLPLMVDASTFMPTSIPSINVTADTCTVGIYADMNTGNWLNADDFVFEPVPPG